MRGKFLREIFLAAICCCFFSACQTPLNSLPASDAGRAADAVLAPCYTDSDCGPDGSATSRPSHVPSGSSAVTSGGGECHPLVSRDLGVALDFAALRHFDCDPLSMCNTGILPMCAGGLAPTCDARPPLICQPQPTDQDLPPECTQTAPCSTRLIRVAGRACARNVSGLRCARTQSSFWRRTAGRARHR